MVDKRSLAVSTQTILIYILLQLQQMNSVNPFDLAGVAVICAENIVQCFQPPRSHQRCFVGLARSDIARNDDLCAPGTCAAVRL